MNKHILHQKRLAPGFTLIEVVITLAVIAIVAALASPAFLAMAPEIQLRSAGMDLYANVREAKILAIKYNSDVILRYDSTGYYFDLDGDGNPDTGEDANYNGILDAGEDTDGDGNLDLTEDFNNNNILDAGEDVDGDGNFDNINEKYVLFAVEYPNYGVGLGRGGTATDWNGTAIPDPYPAGSITFNSRGTTQNANIFIDNQDDNITYAVTTRVAGAIKMRKFNGTSWIE